MVSSAVLEDAPLQESQVIETINEERPVALACSGSIQCARTLDLDAVLTCSAVASLRTRRTAAMASPIGMNLSSLTPEIAVIEQDLLLELAQHLDGICRVANGSCFPFKDGLI